jgi:hypothetical protein
MHDDKLEHAPIMCDLTAIPADVREQHVATVPRIFLAAQEVCELPDGYAFRLPNEADMFMTLAHFVENERRCCPFYRFGLEVEPNGGALWLRLTGGEGAKQLLQQALGEPHDAATIKDLINTGANQHLDQTVEQAMVALTGVLR